MNHHCAMCGRPISMQINPKGRLYYHCEYCNVTLPAYDDKGKRLMAM